MNDNELEFLRLLAEFQISLDGHAIDDELKYAIEGKDPELAKRYDIDVTINGGEGQGDHIECVVDITLSTGRTTFVLTGQYDSWNGTFWDAGEFGEAEYHERVVVEAVFSGHAVDWHTADYKREEFLESTSQDSE